MERRKTQLMMSIKSKSRSSGKTGQHRANERGFSMIETSVALVILMIAGLGVASVFTYSIQYNSGGNDRAVAISVAQQQMEQFRSVPFTDPLLAVGGPTVLSPDTLSNGRSYRVTKTITGANNNVSGNPTLKTITIRVDPMGSGWAGFPVILRTIRTTTTTGTH